MMCPLVDVTELLCDPDFVGPMKVVSRTATVNNRGENQIGTVTTNTVGSVQPAPNKEVMKLPEAMRLDDVRAFFVRASIKTSTYPDVLEFNGRRYQVISVEDWQDYGAGWNKGLCVAEKMA